MTTETRTEYAVLYTYRKPAKGERPDDHVRTVASKEEAEKLIAYFSKPLRDNAAGILTVALLTRTVTVEMSDWEPDGEPTKVTKIKTDRAGYVIQ